MCVRSVNYHVSCGDPHSVNDTQAQLKVRYITSHYTDVIMSVMASQITSLTIVYSRVYSGADQRKYQTSSASLAFVRGIHRSPANSSHKGPATRYFFHVMTSSWAAPVLSLQSTRITNRCSKYRRWGNIMRVYWVAVRLWLWEMIYGNDGKEIICNNNSLLRNWASSALFKIDL